MPRPSLWPIRIASSVSRKVGALVKSEMERDNVTEADVVRRALRYRYRDQLAEWREQERQERDETQS